MAGLSIMLLTGLVLGWVAGRRFQKASRGWSDYRARKAELPGLRAIAILLTRNAFLFVVLAVVVAALALYSLSSEGM